MDTIEKLLVLSAMVLSTIFLAAQNKPDLSGTWDLNVAKSNMDNSPVTKLLVQIEHKDPVLKYSASGTAAGENFTESETINTDGRRTTDSRGMQVRGRWEGTTLVIESTAGDGRVLDVTHVVLSADGKTMVRDYEAKTPDNQQKRHEIYEKR